MQRLFWLAVLLALPFLMDDYLVGVASTIFIWATAGIAMMVLLGFSGQVSIGHAAFLALGAYGEALLIQHGIPFPLSIVVVAAATLLIGVLVGLPSLRFSGLYLAMATLAFAFIVEAFIGDMEITGGRSGMSVDDVIIFGTYINDPWTMYYLALVFAVLAYWLADNLVHSRTGRALQAIRDSEIAAAGMGVEIAHFKIIAFGFSASVTGIAGALLAHKVGYLSPDGFTLQQSIELLVLVVVGGLGALNGAIYGAIFIILLPVVLSITRDLLPARIAELPGLEAGVFGIVLIVVILFQPKGFDGAARAVKNWLRLITGSRRGSHE